MARRVREQRPSSPASWEERFWRAALLASCVLGFGFLIVPIFAVLPISFSSGSTLGYPLPGFSLHWYAEIFSPRPWGMTLTNSLIIAAATTVLATILGTLAAYWLTVSEFRYKKLLVAFLLAPMVVPLVILALAFYFAFSQIGIRGTYLSLIVAHSVLATPFVIVTVTATMSGFDGNLVRAGQSLGASPLPVFREITLPLIMPGVLAGAVFAFMTSFDEVVVALFISSPTTKTLPIELFAQLREQLTPAIVAISSLLIVFSVTTLGLAQFVRSRGQLKRGEK